MRVLINLDDEIFRIEVETKMESGVRINNPDEVALIPKGFKNNGIKDCYFFPDKKSAPSKKFAKAFNQAIKEDHNLDRVQFIKDWNSK